MFASYQGDRMLTITELKDNQYQITCNIHLLSKISSKRDLKRNSFCTMCKRDLKAKEFENKFKAKASEIHNNKYNYDNSNYIKNSIPLTIKCILHNIEFEQTPADHLSGKTGCRQCIIAKQPQKHAKSLDKFIEQANKIHRNIFDYSKVEYKTTHTHVNIKCIQHNHIFTQTPAHHLQGKNGCELCKNKGLVWSREDFINAYNHKDCKFYIIKCFNENEEFYKIGITSKSVKQRYNKYNLPYNYTTILEYTDSAENVWDIEYQLKNQLTTYAYTPLIPFKGSATETFQLDNILLKDILFNSHHIILQ